MHGDRDTEIHREPDGPALWRRGQRRGEFEAVRYVHAPGEPEPKRERRTLSTANQVEADRLIEELNQKLITGGETTVAALFDLYKHAKTEKGKWGRDKQHAFKAIVPALGSLPCESISQTVCEDYIEKRLEEGYAPDSVRLEMAYLRAALRHAWKRGLITTQPHILVPPRGKPREKWCTLEEISRLIDGAVLMHMKLFIILGVTTAARPSHILQLTWEDGIDFEHRLIDFGAVDNAASNKRRPKLPMNDTAYEHLQVAYKTRRTPYVIEYRKSSVESVKKGILRAGQRAGLPWVTQYVLRHTAGVWMAKDGVPIEQIAEYMGHSDIEITRRHYAHFQPQFMRQAAKALELPSKR